MNGTTTQPHGHPWALFQHARRAKGLTMEKITELAGLNRSQIWGMLTGIYGQPDTPEKRARILAALNQGPGEPVSESDIWPTESDQKESA